MTTPRSRRSRRVFAAVGVALLLGGFFAWRGLRLSELAHLGTGYSAELTCACLFISRRPLDSCRKDLDKLAQLLVSVEAQVDDRLVTARSLGLAKATARYRDGFGCAVDP
jgi:hypothetical protein